MTPDRFQQIRGYMKHLNVETALRWCHVEACACLGCANRGGGLEKRGVTHSEWLEFWRLAIKMNRERTLAPE